VQLYQLGPQRFVDRALVAWARSSADAHDPAWSALVALPERWTVPLFPLKAKDFIGRGIPHGPALGAALRAAEAAWIAADFPADASSIEAIANTAAQSARSHKS
jgi:poly(A) polymerase